jgi:hypothetical protein
MNPILLGVSTMAALLLLSYFFRERSLRRLDVTQAGTLVLTLRPIRVRFTLIYLGSVVAWLLIIYLLPHQKPALLVVSLLWLLICIGVAQWVGWQALRKGAFPPDFFRNYGAAAVLTFLAYATVIGAVLATSFLYSKG